MSITNSTSVMSFLPTRPTWIEINRAALLNNVAQIRQMLSKSTRFMAVVKANAYGHGLSEVAPILAAAGVDYLAVATLSEALELRAENPQIPILVLGFTPSWLAEGAIRNQITLTVFDLASAQHFNQVAKELSTVARIHVKVNTGMNRLGAKPFDTVPLLAELRQLPHLFVEGIFNHFATSDQIDKTFAWQQFELFVKLLTELESNNLRPILAHTANSAAMLTMPSTHLDMVRSGIAIYGLDPDPDETPLPSGFQPVLSWKALIAQVTQLQPGESVSYGREFVAERTMQIAVIPVGYADGFPRRPYNYGSVLVHGRHAPILGRVCMDQTIIDVTEIATYMPVKQGDEVVIIGKQGQTHITAEDVARQIHSNNYDVVSRILGRVPRILR